MTVDEKTLGHLWTFRYSRHSLALDSFKHLKLYTTSKDRAVYVDINKYLHVVQVVTSEGGSIHFIDEYGWWYMAPKSELYHFTRAETYAGCRKDVKRSLDAVEAG